MSEFLYDLIREKKSGWAPAFAMQSTLNWANALSFEISQEHSPIASEQFESLQIFFSDIVSPRNLSNVRLGDVFEPLFHALTFSVSLTSFESRDVVQPWTYPAAVMDWYYANYFAFRSIVAAYDSSFAETHSKLQKIVTMGGLGAQLPHPLNMVASWQGYEEYLPVLPSYPSAEPYPIVRRFEPSREVAQGMLLLYLKGTAGYLVGELKDRISRREGFKDFRTKKAREARDAAIRNQLAKVGFLHCAFRYRGKSNYRDATFLTYGDMDSRFDGSFVWNLANASRFAFICALAYAESRIGRSKVQDFLEDVRENVRGSELMNSDERFWTDLI